MRKKKGKGRDSLYQKLRDNRERIETRGFFSQEEKGRWTDREREEEEGIALFFERDRTGVVIV